MGQSDRLSAGALRRVFARPWPRPAWITDERLRDGAAGLARLDRNLLRTAAAGIPLALLLAVASGLALPHLTGWKVSFAGLRVLHLLAGAGLACVVTYDLAAILGAAAQAAWRRMRRPEPGGGPVRQRAVIRDWLAQWKDRSAAQVLSVVYWLMLAALVWTGLAQYWAQRAGFSLLPGVPAAAAGAWHAVLAPYSYGIFLIVWMIRAEAAARRLLHEMRSP